MSVPANLTAPIRTKKEMYRLSQQGYLGNPPLVFPSPVEAVDWAYRHPGRELSLRSIRPCFPLFRAHLSPRELVELYESYRRQGILAETLIISESIRHEQVLIQGEVVEVVIPSCIVSPRFEYSTLTTNMRDALSQERRCVWGLSARQLLRSYMDQKSWECLWELLARYPDHVLEITVCDRPVGRFRWNTMFWEVRRY